MTPEWLYHLALPDDWSEAAATGRYRWSTRAMTVADVGFVHLSHRHQVLATAGRFYGDCAELVLLQLDRAALGSPVIEEPAPSGERFPHLYGELPVAAVVRAERWMRSPDGWVAPPYG